MTLNKLLSFALLAVTIVMMMGRCSAYHDNAFWQCYNAGPCYRYPNGTQQGCPPYCGCVSRRYYEGIYYGLGNCVALPQYG
uniref:Putative secreted protein n=1 Tax=Amblyomma americanum TaxID=6943 RepID=A0A0C9S3A7_AMBAM